MVVWLPWVWLLLVLAYPVTGQEKHYMGGSISFTWNNQFFCKLTVITGWTTGKGPCGPLCDLQKIGKGTRGTREQMEADHDNSYFGTWNVSNDPSGFDTFFQNSMSSYTSALNTPGQWEQEVMEADIYVVAKENYEIKLGSLYWRPFKYNYEEYASSVLQVVLKPLKRNDTGLPNNSPVVMFKPLYRILLNKPTKIVLSTMDKDDDFVRCEVSPATLTAVKTMPKATVSEDCSITVAANERDGFFDKGYGIVSLVARDFNKHVITVGGETRTVGGSSPLSTVMVQFMVETVKTDDGPSFLPPTRESQHEFVVYTGSVLEIPLYATNGPLVMFYARSLPRRQFNVPFPQIRTLNDTYMTSTTVTWKPTEADVGFYLFSVSVIDAKGRDGMNRNYKIIVKAASTTPSTTATTTTTTTSTTTKPTSTTTTTPTSTTTTSTSITTTTSTTTTPTTITTTTTTSTPTTTTSTFTPTTTTTNPKTTTSTTTTKPTTTPTTTTTTSTSATTTSTTSIPTTTTNTATTSATTATSPTVVTTKSTITTTSSTTVITNTIPKTTTTRPTTIDATSITSSTVTKATTAKPAITTPTNMITTAITTTAPTTTTTTPRTTTTTTTTITVSQTSTITNSKAFTTPTSTQLGRGIHQRSASTAPVDPSVHNSSTSTFGFPSCSEAVNPRPSNQCLCLSDNQLIQCPSRKFGTVNSQKQDDTGSMSVVVPVLGCVAGLTAGVIAIFIIKKFCCPCSKINKVSADSLESLKQEDEERYVERKPKRHYPQHERNNPRAQRKLHSHHR